MKILALKGNDGLRACDPQTCCVCQKEFSDRRWLIDHLDEFHYKIRKLSCDLCSKRFYKKATMVQHIKSHRKKEFQCKVCGFEATRRAVFERHQLKHVKCPVCKKLVPSLRDHMKTHKPKRMCLICRRNFTAVSFKEHMKTHDEKAFKCQKCEERFENAKTLGM